MKRSAGCLPDKSIDFKRLYKSRVISFDDHDALEVIPRAGQVVF
jgi:hypothetical protein